MAKKLHVGYPNIGNKAVFLERADQILNSFQLTNDGKFVREFESKLEEFLGVKNCITVNTGTMALELIIGALELTGSVIVPSFTFIATVHALKRLGIDPIFCDIDPITHHINPDKIEGLIRDDTTAIIGVHLWGRPCNVDAICNVGLRNNLHVFFDAAHAFGCSHKGKMVGNFGEAEAFSFHATKVLNAFEGGLITTNNDFLADKLKNMKRFGFCGYDNVTCLGTNGKMNEISAAMGITNLESLDIFIRKNYQNCREYENRLDKIHGVRMLKWDENEKNNYQYIVIEVKRNRDHIINKLHSEGILARRYFYPGCHRMEPYRSMHKDDDLPITNSVCGRVIVLPNGMQMEKGDIEKICGIIEMELKC